MNLYQAGYFRKGRQGSNAGWGIVAPSKGMSQIAKDGFKGIAAKLVELKGSEGMPVVNTGLFLHDRFVYLMNVNYAAQGEDARGVTYVHGYCFSIADYYELCADPAKICAVMEESFPLEYDDKITDYPVVNKLKYAALSFAELLEKYHLTDDEYRMLVLGAINAIENYSNPLCICLSLPREQYKEAYQELLYLIMKGLPLHLRIKISAFSYARAGAAIYVSDHTEGNNYFDLDTREAVIDTSRMSQLGFTRLYNTLPAKAEAQRDLMLQAMADFINTAFENPLKDAGCALVEAGFQEKVKKNDEEGIVADKAEELLKSFLGYKLTNTPEVFDYLTDLLAVINQTDRRITDSKTAKKLEELYSKSQYTQFEREMDILLAHQILDQGAEGYKKLNGLLKSEQKYQVVCEEIQKRNAEYYRAYYLNSYLKHTLTSLKSIQTYLEQNKIEDLEEQKVLLRILDHVVEKEMSMSEGYEGLKATKDLVIRILSGFSEKLDSAFKAIEGHTDFLLWKNFRMAEFDLEMVDDYKEMKVAEVAARGWLDKSCPTACNVMKLIELFEETDQEAMRDLLIQILFENTVLTTAEEKQNVQEIFRNERLDDINFSKISGIDCLLALYYDFGKKRFKMLEWGKYVKRKAPEYLEADAIRQMKKRSVFLANENWSEIILQDIQDTLANVKRNKSQAVSKDVIRGLKTYSDCLSGKKIRNDKEQQMHGSYCDALHRIAIGALMIYVLEFLLRMQGNSFDLFGEYIWLAGIAILILLTAVITVFKISRECGFENMLELYGMDSIPRLIVYVAVSVILWTGIAAIMFLNRERLYLIGGIFYGLLALISAIVNCVCAEE